MSQRIDGPLISPTQAQPLAGGETQAVIGSFMGERVQVQQDAQSLLADAAEELSFSASEEAERKLDERAEGKGKDKDLNKILFYISQMDQAEQEKARHLLPDLAKLKQADARAVLDTVRQAFKDPTDRHAALHRPWTNWTSPAWPRTQ
jgi:type III secretion protein W